jgi:hypothetical protein
MDARPRRVVGALVALLAVTALTAIGAAAAGAETVYNNVPSPLPGNFASIGLEATSSSEFGGEIELAGTARSQPTVTVVMSSWACQMGTIDENNCITRKPKATFKVPVTIRVYPVGEIDEGPLVATTKNIKMKYRPTSDVAKCGPGRWYDEADKACYHGYAFPISIKLSKLKKMPKRSIVTVAYPHSSGPAQSLNVAVSEPPEETLSLGAQPVEEWFVNSTWSGMYCAGTPGTLGGEGGTCSTEAEGIDYQPVFAVSAN